jgi:transcriptional regulator with XRE-family HTH domain
MHFGERIKELRESKGLLQRQLAATLEIDTPMFSKIERGDRKAKRDQVITLAKLLGTKEDELLTLWLADQVYDLVKDEEVGVKAIQAAEEEIKLKVKSKKNNAI